MQPRPCSCAVSAEKSDGITCSCSTAGPPASRVRGSGTGGAHAAAESATLPLLQALLQRAPELRLLVTATAPVTALPGVAQRQLLLGPMAAEQA